jgi:signal transduction histidine kinase
VALALPKPLRAVVERGVRAELDGTLAKRVRLTNVLALFGALVMLASIPFDWRLGPRWMVVEDVVGAAAYLCLPLLNARGHVTGSRLAALALSNALVLANAAILGHDSGAEMVFIALSAVPFALFDLRERAALAFGVLLPVGAFVLADSEALRSLRHVPGSYSARAYHLYSGFITLAVIVYSVFQSSLANARAERALRDDIQARQRAERELELTRQTSIYSAKMAALGEMSGNIAHEVNNPLAAILLRAQHMERLMATGPPDKEALNKDAREIGAIVLRIQRIVDALRAFARDAEKDPMRVESVAGIVRETVDLCAQKFQGHEIELVVEPIAGELTVRCRAVQISQILLNLLSNAHDAVEDRRTRWVRVSAEADAGQVRIAVEDSGPGVAPELAARIMEPFFTTKQIGKGTGLGLSVSKGIAESHGGELRHEDSAPHTRFVLSLPRS